MKSNLKKALIQIVFWLHLPIVVLWFGLFFVPNTIWPEKIVFHFLFITIIVGIQLLWGLIYFPITKKIDLICPQTTLMQWLRGYPLKNKKNYGHSFVAELFKRLNISISYKFVNVLLIITLIIIVAQYFLKQ